MKGEVTIYSQRLDDDEDDDGEDEDDGDGEQNPRLPMVSAKPSATLLV